jgi:hypothetical protein
VGPPYGCEQRLFVPLIAPYSKFRETEREGCAKVLRRRAVAWRSRTTSELVTLLHAVDPLHSFTHTACSHMCLSADIDQLHLPIRLLHRHMSYWVISIRPGPLNWDLDQWHIFLTPMQRQHRVVREKIMSSDCTTTTGTRPTSKIERYFGKMRWRSSMERVDYLAFIAATMQGRASKSLTG